MISVPSNQSLAIQVTNLETRIGGQIIHHQLNFKAYQGEVMGVVGGSGSGKSVFLNILIGLRRVQAGEVKILGKDITALNEADRQYLRSEYGVLFQSGALFGSLTVLENIMVPLREVLDVPQRLAMELAKFRLQMVGLPVSAASKYPAQLSGGMIKRVALARALAIDPKILFLDEPTSGLDSISTRGFNDLIYSLQKSLGITVIMITHDLVSLFAVCDRVSVLINRQLISGTLDELENHSNPWIKEYFHGHGNVQKSAGKSHGK